MTASLNDIGVVPSLDVTMEQLIADVEVLIEQNEELERLGRAVVEAAQGNHETVLIATPVVQSLAAWLARIKDGRS